MYIHWIKSRVCLAYQPVLMNCLIISLIGTIIALQYFMLTCFHWADIEEVSKRSKCYCICSNSASVGITSIKWANVDERFNSMECEESTSNNLCHFHKIEPDQTINVNSWWGYPIEGDECWADSNAGWSARHSSWHCRRNNNHKQLMWIQSTFHTVVPLTLLTWHSG